MTDAGNSTGLKLAAMDRAAEDPRLSHLDFRLFWLLCSASDRRTGVVRRRQSDLARRLDIHRRTVERCRDHLVALRYLKPIGDARPGYVMAYQIVTAENAAPAPHLETCGTSAASDAEDAAPALPAMRHQRRLDAAPAPQTCGRPTAYVPFTSQVTFPSDDRDTIDRPAPRQCADALGAGLGQEQGKGLSEGSEDAPPEANGITDAGETVGLLNGTPLGTRLRQRIGEQAYLLWFDEVEQVSLSDGLLKLSAPARYIAARIESWFATDLAELTGAHRVKVILRKSKPPAEASP